MTRADLSLLACIVLTVLSVGAGPVLGAAEEPAPPVVPAPQQPAPEQHAAKDPAAANSPWSEDLEKVLASDGDGRPVVVLLTSPGCVWCERMLRESADTAAVRQALGQVTALRVHADEHPEMVASFDIKGFPTTLLINRKRQVVRTVAGYIPATDFVTMLRVLILHGDEQVGTAVHASTERLAELARRADGAEKLIELLGRGDPRQRREVRALLAAKPDIHEKLWAALEDPLLGARVDASAVLAEKLGGDGGYDPFATAAERSEAAAVWHRSATQGTGAVP